MNSGALAGFQQLIQGTRGCLEARLELPSLILIYSGIDIAGWLDAEREDEPVSQSFARWVNRYLLTAKPFKCTAVDLYAARCGLVHTLTPEAKLVEQKKARYLGYAWGNATAAALQQATDPTETRMVAVHVNELFEAFQLGLTSFIEDVCKDDQGDANQRARQQRVLDRAGKAFCQFLTYPDGKLSFR